MYEGYGNIVLLKGTDLKSKFLIGGLTWSAYHHTGLLTSENTMDIMTQKGVVENRLSIEELEKEQYGDYLIVEPKGITDEIRRKIKFYNDGMYFRNFEYDHENINNIAKRCLTFQSPDLVDISSGGLICNSRIGRMFKESRFPIKVKGKKVDPSQLLAPHFLDKKYFKIVYDSRFSN